MSDMPSIFSKIKNLARTTKDVATHYLQTGDIISKELALKRQSICNSCSYNKNNICTDCGCTLIGNSFAPGKTELIAATCGLNKWSSIKKD